MSISAPDITEAWRPTRRTFLRAGAAAVLVTVVGRWPTGEQAAEAASFAGEHDLYALIRRRGSVAGPPSGNSHGNVLVRSEVLDGVDLTVWHGGGGRAFALGKRGGEVEALYIDPTRRATANAVRIAPLSELAHEIRSHFGEGEWRSIVNTAEGVKP